MPSEKVSKLAKAMTTEEKYRGLISRAVMERERQKEESVIAVEKTDSLKEKQNRQTKPMKKAPEKPRKADEDEKVDAKGNHYIQASMQFDENYEIIEF